MDDLNTELVLKIKSLSSSVYQTAVMQIKKLSSFLHFCGHPFLVRKKNIKQCSCEGNGNL